MIYPPESARNGFDAMSEELEPNHTHYLLLEADGQVTCAGSECSSSFRDRSGSNARDAVYDGMSEAELGRLDLRDIALKVDFECDLVASLSRERQRLKRTLKPDPPVHFCLALHTRYVLLGTGKGS